MVFLLFAMLPSLLAVTGLAPTPAAAVGGAYTLDFSAADPADYIPPIPFPSNVTPIVGAGNGDTQIPDAYFISPVLGTEVNVESLAPEDMALGQVVPFEIEITVSGSTAPEDGNITFDAGWNIDTTSNNDFGYDDTIGVLAAFIDTGDGAHLDPDGDATVSSFSWQVVGDEIVGTFNVSGLDDGDVVVLEAWLVLDDSIPAGSTGNVQSRLISAETVADSPDTINTGNQAVPLLRVQEFFSADADLSITKSDDPDPVQQGATLTYTVEVANAGPSIANNVVVTDTLDPNTTFVSATADNGGTCAYTTVVTCDLGAIVPGAENNVTITIVVTVNDDAPYEGNPDLFNTVTVESITDDPDTSNNTADEPTDVELAGEAPIAEVVKGNAAGDDNVATLPEPGGSVSIPVTVTNNAAPGTGDAELISLIDDVYGDLDGQGDCSVPQPIPGGGSYSCSFTVSISEIGTITDTVTATLENAFGTDEASDQANTVVTDVPSVIEIIKTATPDNVDEPGGSVTFSFVINNLSVTDEVTIDTLNDSIYGDLNGQGDCSVPQTIAAGGSYPCSFTTNVTGNAGDVETNVVTASGTDDDGNPVSDDDDATVTINDVAASIEVIKTANPTSVPEPGDDVTFTFTVNNTSATDEVTITTLEDSIYGDLNGQNDCSVPQTIAAGGSYSCSITEFVGGSPGETINNVLTVGGTDDDGNPVGGTDDADVTVTDVPSGITATKTASPSSVPESGGDVTYTFVVTNDSTVDSVTIDTLSDSIYGDLNGQNDCSVPQTIAPGGSYTCSITELVSGNAGAVITNVLTASGTDDDGNPVSDDDDAVVTITDVPASIEVIKEANPTSVPEPGGDVTFTFTVDNTSATDEVTIDTLDDSIYGDLNGQGDCSVPQTIAAGESYSCSITEFVAGNAGDQITNVLTVAGTDDDGNDVGGTDDATVDVTDVPSSILVTKTADPTSVPETGGDVTYTVTILNTSAVDTVTINTMVDDRVANASDGCTPSLPADIAPNETITCTYTAFVEGDFGSTHTNVATAMGEDDDGNPVSDNDDETVTFEDVAASIEVIKTANPTSVDEPGGNVTFTFVINNTSPVDLVNITSLEDSIYGDLDGQGDCEVPQTLPVDGSYTCSFTTFVAGNAGDAETNVVTATGVDDDGSTVTDTDDATVTINDVPSSIEVTKSANPTSVPETGGDVTFTVKVENTSLVDSVTINSVVDTQFGDVSASCVPALPATIAPTETITCTFTEFISGDAGETHVNVATASGEDDDGNPVEDDDDEEIPFDDVKPDITVTKTADPTSVPETGGDVTFTFLVTNNATEDATLDSLIDSDFGDLNGQGDCSVPQPLAASGGSYQCSILVNISGDASGPDHNNVVTATASDDDGNTTSDDDDETVVFDDVLPDVSITKTANPTSVPETGGDVEFTIVVTNNSLEDATIDSLVDTDFDLATRCSDAVGTVLAFGESYTCTFTETLSGDASGPAHENTATVVASDGDGNTDTESDDETVTFDDVLPTITVDKSANPTSVSETGGDVEFTIVVTNTSDEPVTVLSLEDSDFDLAANCPDAVGTVLAPSDSYTCTFTETLVGDASGPAHENTATAVAEDNEGNDATDSDDATVDYEDVLPDISVVKTANPTSVPETGADVVFTFEVTNNAAEDATLDSLVDSDFGDLNGQGTCAVAQPLAANGGTYTCEITVFISGDFGGPAHNNVVTATASDNEGNPAMDEDDATVDFTDVLPDISIVKAANPTSVDEPGGNVSFTLVITNNSLEEVNIDSLTDSDYNEDLAASCPEATSISLAFEQTYTCVFSAFVDGNAADGPHENTATVVGSDDDGNIDEASDDEAVIINDVLPIIEVTKTPNQTEVFAPGEDVTFTIRVENNSVSSDPVTITSIVDDVFGDVSTECVLPQTIGVGGAFECDITRTISSDHTNTVTATGADDEGNEVSDSDDASVEVSNPSITIEKSTGPADADTPPGPEILVGETVNWFYQVTNDGDVDLENLVVTDDQDVTVDCAVDALVAGASTVCTASGTATIGQYANIGTATASYTDADGDTAERSDSDPSHYFGATPSLAISKTFADDEVIAGGAGSSFDIVVTNDGNVDLTGVSITDTVDSRLTVTGVSSSAGDCSASSGQDIDCTVDLAAGDSLTVTVDFSVASDVEEADGVGGLNDGEAVTNTATASNVYTDDVDNSTTLEETATDTVDIKVDIDLSITKTFARSDVPQGTSSSFTLVVSNNGPSDAVGVSITDEVDDSIAVTGVSLSGTGTCDAPSQSIDCTVDIPAGESVTVTVDYIAAPFLDGSSGNLGGDDFRFVFTNGSVLEGSTATGEVFLDGVDVSNDVTIISGLNRNDVIFDPPGPDPAFELHLSCSDPFTGGWGQSGGPVEGVDDNWQIAYFSIARFNNNGFIKNCGNVTNPFDVPNTATATGEDSFGTETASDTDVLTIGPGITLDRLQTNGKRLTVRLTNFTGDDKTIDEISVVWPSSNGDLTKIRLDDPTVWQGTAAPPSTVLDFNDPGWNGGVLSTGEGILRFDFENKSARNGYTIRVTFTDGTFLDINQ